MLPCTQKRIKWELLLILIFSECQIWKEVAIFSMQLKKETVFYMPVMMKMRAICGLWPCIELLDKPTNQPHRWHLLQKTQQFLNFKGVSMKITNWETARKFYPCRFASKYSCLLVNQIKFRKMLVISRCWPRKETRDGRIYFSRSLQIWPP